MSAILFYLPTSEKLTVTSQEYFSHYEEDIFTYEFEGFKCDCCDQEGHDIPLIAHSELGEICPTCLKEHLEDTEPTSEISVVDIFEARAFVSQHPIFAGEMASQVKEMLSFLDAEARVIWRGNYRMIVKGKVESSLIIAIVDALLLRQFHPDTITQSAPEPDYDNEAQAYQENSIL